MIHRRQRPDASAYYTSPASSSPAPAPYSPMSPVSPPTANPSFVPLRPYGHVSSGSFSGMGGMGGMSGMGGMGGDNSFEEEFNASQFVVSAARGVRAGVLDSVRLDKSWGLVWGDAELRTLVLKLTLLNLLSLALLSTFPLISSLAGGSASVHSVSLWYNVLFSWPTFAVVFWINALWGPDVARRAQSLLHPGYRHQINTPTFSDDPGAWGWMTFTRLLLIADFTFVFRLCMLIPVLGWPLGLGYMALINAYYAFEWIFVSRAWAIDQRCRYIANRSAYMFGFGLPATLLTTFGPPVLNMAVFTLLYPFLLIQALQAVPPEIDTPKHYGVPVFFFARHLLNGCRFLADAVMRERGGYAARRRGKRAQ